MAGTAAAIGVPLAAGAAWKAKQSLDQNKYASFEEATELAIEKLAAMSKQEQKNLFRPFVQAETGVTRRFGGTGLGLAICAGLCALMGCPKIQVDSVKGRGTTFTASVMPVKTTALPVSSSACRYAVVTSKPSRTCRWRRL